MVEQFYVSSEGYRGTKYDCVQIWHCQLTIQLFITLISSASIFLYYTVFAHCRDLESKIHSVSTLLAYSFIQNSYLQTLNHDTSILPPLVYIRKVSSWKICTFLHNFRNTYFFLIGQK